MVIVDTLDAPGGPLTLAPALKSLLRRAPTVNMQSRQSRREVSLDDGDTDLLARYAQGDHGAAEALTARHGPRIMSLARRMLGDPAEAEDVTQETMLRLWLSAPTWRRDEAKVGTWLYRVATNQCIDRLRKRARRAGEPEIEVADTAPGVVQKLERRDRAAVLQAALAKLPPRQRAAVVLRHLEEKSNPEIAEVLGTTVEAVESLLSRGRRELAALLAPSRETLRLESHDHE